LAVERGEMGMWRDPPAHLASLGGGLARAAENCSNSGSGLG
jgi:hypothetical protein